MTPFLQTPSGYERVFGNPVLDSLDGEVRAPLGTILHPGWPQDYPTQFGVHLIDVTPPTGKKWSGDIIEGNDGPEAVFVDVLLDDLRATAIARVNKAYNQSTDTLAAAYPDRERESWHVQIREAEALLDDAGADTPWIDAAAAAREITRLDLAQRIQANDQLYRQVQGSLSGTRQRLVDEINDAETAKAINAVHWPTE